MRDRCPPAQPRPGRSKHVLLPGPRVPSEATPRLTWDSPRLGVAMEPTAAAKFTGRLSLLFLLLRLLRGIAAAPAGLGVGAGATRGGGETDALSLSYHFSITSQARPGQPWCEIQGEVNGKTFLSYDCQSKEFKPIGPWGMKLKDTAFWQKQEETLKLLVEELRKKLLDIKAEIFTKSGSLTMQGRLMCERGADGHARESWWFCFNKQLTHLFDPKNRKWTVVLPGGQRFKGTLDNDRELTKLLVRTSNADCQSWLQQVWEHWDEMQETTGNSEDWMECWFSCEELHLPHSMCHQPCDKTRPRPGPRPSDPAPGSSPCSSAVWSYLASLLETIRWTGCQVHQETSESGTSSATLPLGQLPLDELLFIIRWPPAFSSLQIQRPQSNHVVQDREPLIPLLAFGGSPVQHFPLAYSMPFSVGAT